MKIKIVFTEPGTIFGRFVRLVIGGKWTHIHFVIEKDYRKYTYEAFPPGVRLVGKNLYLGLGEEIEIPLDKKNCQVIFDHAIYKSQNSCYGISDSLRIFIRNRISKKLARWIGYFNSDKSETCSTLAINTLRLIWKDFGGEDALEFGPDEVYQAIIAKQRQGW